MFEPFLNLFYLNNGLNAAQIGWMAAVLPFCTLLINPLVSRLADFTQRRIAFLAATCVGFGLALGILSIKGLHISFPLLVGLVTLISIFRGPVNPLADSLIASMATRHQLDFGRMRLWGSITFTLSAVSLGAVWQQTGYNWMFAISGLFFMPVLFAVLLLEELPRAGSGTETDVSSTAKENTPATIDPASSMKRDRFRMDPGLLFLIGSTFLILAGLFMAGTFGAVYVTGLGGSPALVGAMMGLAAAGEVPGMLFSNRIARRTGDTNALLGAYVTIAVGLYGYTLSSQTWALLAFAIVRGVGFGVLLTATVTILNRRAPREQASTYQGILSAACWGLAPLLGGPISGWVYQTYGPNPFFTAASLLSVCAAFLILPTYRFWKTNTLV